MGKIYTKSMEIRNRINKFGKRNKQEIAFVKKYAKKSGKFVKKRAGIITSNIRKEQKVVPYKLRAVSPKDLGF